MDNGNKLAFLEIYDWEADYLRQAFEDGELFISEQTIDKVDSEKLRDMKYYRFLSIQI